MMSAIEVNRAFIQAHLVDRQALTEAQEKCDPLMALSVLKQAFVTDVTPILARARELSGGAIDPLAAYRASDYRKHKAEERPARAKSFAGIV
jgi:L-rhamnose isomerase/sugar isomerase